MDIETSDFLSVLRFLQYLKKHFVKVIVSVIVIASIVYFLIQHFSSYEASVHFIVNNLPASQVTQNSNMEADMNSVKLNSLQLLYSSDVIGNVADKMDLYTCFRVNKKGARAKENLIQVIRSSMRIEYKKVGGYALSVSCYDRQRSADVANAIMAEADSLNKHLMEEEFYRKSQLMSNLIAHTNENAWDNNKNLMQSIESLQQLTKFLDLQKTKTPGQQDLETRLYKVLALLQENMQDMTRERDYYDVVLKSYMNDNFRFFYVIVPAVPEFGNYILRYIMISLGVAAAVTLLASMTIFYVRRQLSYLTVLGLRTKTVLKPVHEL